MNQDWIESYCSLKKGNVKDYKFEWDATRYMINGKMYALVGQNKEKQDIISLKLNPEYGEFLRDEYEDVNPGYYLNKIHWNSIHLNGTIPNDLIKELIDQSYSIILHSFSKKKQQEILNEKNK